VDQEMAGMNVLSDDLLSFDSELHETIKKINILNAVNPIDYAQQKKQFFESRFSIEPSFSYVEHKVDVFDIKRKLFNLPLEVVKDEDLQKIYFDTINSYVDKVDQFNSIGSADFVYDSLRYFGEPTSKDIGNARFILHLPPNKDEDKEANLNFEQIKQVLSDFADTNQYDYSIKVEDNMIANALVSGTTIKVNQNASMSKSDANALAQHEIGVHLVTTLNARKQALRILEVGNPLNTMTQEGLAILSEYLSDNLSIKRLKVLALRVLAVQSMIKERSFKHTFNLLREEYAVNNELAFTITARIFRGGGFVKDYLYLQGFHKMLNAFENEPDFQLLFCGKTSIAYLPHIRRLVDKGFFVEPKFIAPIFKAPEPLNETKKYIAHAIK
jgi:uncharacterized protein (TIGR02421 family)